MPRSKTKTRGAAFHEAVAGEYELGPHELELLAEVAVMLDRLDLLEAAVAADGVMLNGRVHPAAVESRQVSNTLRQHLHALGLPDVDGESVRSRQAGRAGRARWSRDDD